MTVWTGGFVHEAAGVVVRSDRAHSLVPVRSLVGLALRVNPKRAQLLVSTVLAKHVPTVPAVAVAAGELLGLLVAGVLDGVAVDGEPYARFAELLPGETDDAALAGLRAAIAERRSTHPEVITLGYAETATGLGQLVAGAIGSPYLHSTRHAAVDGAPSFAFEEEHSHASSHRLHPTRGAWLHAGGTVVLVDDEMSTGATIVNTIRMLQAVEPQAAWVVAALVDLRCAADRELFDALAVELSTRITVVALGRGEVDLPSDVLQRAAEVIAGFAGTEGGAIAVDTHGPMATLGTVVIVEGAATVRSGRYGVAGVVDATVVAEIAAGILPHLLSSAASSAPAAAEVLVLGSEEFIAVPLLVADELDRWARAEAGVGRVLFSTTTRSPIAPLDRADYAIASGIRFRSCDLTLDGFGDRFAYNLTRAGQRFGTIVLLPEPGSDRDRLLADDGVVQALRSVSDHVVVALLPADIPAPDEWTTQP